MANRYRRGEREQQGYDDDRGSRQSQQFEQRPDMQYGEDHAADHDDRDYRRGAEMRYQQPRQGRMSGDRSTANDFEGERGYGRRSSRRSGSYDPLSDYDRDEGMRRGGYRDSMRDRNFQGSYDRDRSGYDGRNRLGQGDYSPYERNRDDRGFFDRAGDEIASWFGDDEAERRREMDYRRQQNERARSGESHRGRGPSNYKRSDERILEDACERLTHDHGVDASDMEVTVKNGELTLDGKVNTRWEKRRAEDCVHDVSGVNHVQNNLRIRETDMRAGRTDRKGTEDDTKARTDRTTGTLA